MTTNTRSQTPDVRVSLYNIPNAEYLDRIIHDLTLHPERATINSHTREYRSSYHIYISAKTPYVYNQNTHKYDKNYQTALMSLDIERPPSFTVAPSITINQYPIIIHLSKNLALKLIDVFITICHTSHQDSTLTIKHLYEAKQYIQEAHKTH